MLTSLNTSKKWYDNIWAAFIFFTRLPFWRLHEPPRECYKTVVEHWPLTGWLTGGAMAAIILAGSVWLHISYHAVLLTAIIARILITGALHEDGLCDFFDGFGGGGNNRQRILDIMKDSRIGTYGVLGIIMYELSFYTLLCSLPPKMAAFAVFAADPYAKMIAAQIIMLMPYTRTEEEAKAKTVYRKINVKAGIGLAVQGLLPMALFLYFMHRHVDWQYIIFAPCLVMYFMYLLIWRKLHGYTGDCCGALFLLVELSVYLAMASTMTYYIK